MTDEDRSRHDRIEVHPTAGPHNSLRHWREAKGILRTVVNFLVVWMVRYSPSLKLKVWLLRRLGADVADGVSFALTATPDVFWPELITVKADAIVGYDATILCHEFLQDEYRTGEVVIGERAMIGAGAVILPGVEIGADANVGANAVVTRDVPPGATVTGAPAKPVDATDDVDVAAADVGDGDTGDGDTGDGDTGDGDDRTAAESGDDETSSAD